MDANILKMKPNCELHLLMMQNIANKKWREAYQLVLEIENVNDKIKNLIKLELERMGYKL